MSDRLLVQNSKAMQAILQATQAEAEASRQIAAQSQRLSEEMMKDSVAMKTVGLLLSDFHNLVHTLTLPSPSDRAFDYILPSWNILCGKHPGQQHIFTRFSD